MRPSVFYSLLSTICFWLVLFVFSTSRAQALPLFKYGLIDSGGRELIPPKYGEITYLGNGLFRVMEFKDVGVLGLPQPHLFDSNGKEIQIKIPAGSQLLGVFIPRNAIKASSHMPGTIPEGTLLEVQYRSSQTVADLDGNVLFEQPSLTIQHSQDGSLMVMGVVEPICAFDGETGEKVVDAKKLKRYMLSQSGFGKLSQNRILFSRAVDGRLLWGYYDAEGNVPLEPKYTQARDFDEAGMAPVQYFNEDQKKVFCFIGTDGKALSPPEIIDAEDWHDGLTVVAVRTAENEIRYGIVNRRFEFVVKPDWKSLKYAKTDRYHGWIKDRSDTWIIDSEGKRKSDRLLSCTTYDPTKMIMLYQQWHLDVPQKKFMFLNGANGEVLFSDPRVKSEWLEQGVAVFSEIVKGRDRSGVDRFTIVTDAGVTATDVNAYRLKPATRDRLIKEIVDNAFSSRAWRSDPRSRLYQFSLFLRNHNLIGMEKSEVEKYLGRADDRCFYSICESMVAESATGMELRYKNDRVTGWRWLEKIYGKARYLPWVTTDVIYGCDPFDGWEHRENLLRDLRFVNK